MSSKGAAGRLSALIAQRGFAQGLTFLSTMFVARYVEPSMFGEVGLFTSISSFLAMVAGLRFEVRALVCQQRLTRERYFTLAYLSNAVFFVTLFIVLLIYAISHGDVSPWMWLLPFGVVFTSLVQYILPAQNSQLNQLSRVGWMTQIVALSAAVQQIVVAIYCPSAIGLIVSKLFGWLFGIVFMYRCVVGGVIGAVQLSGTNCLRLVRVSTQEILYGVPAALVSVITLQVPVYVFSYHGMMHEVGIYWLAFNILFVPYLVVVGSLRPILLRKISKNRDPKAVYALMKRGVLICVALGVLISVGLAYACQVLVNVFLGSEWSDAVAFSASLGLLLTSLIAQTPISIAISALRLQKINFLSGVLQVVVRVLAVWVTLSYGFGADVAILNFSIVSAVTYAGYIILCLWLIRNRC